MTFRHQQICQHLDMLLIDYGTRGLRLARKHMAAYCDYLPDSDSLREIVTRSEKAQPVFTALEEYFKSASAYAA